MTEAETIARARSGELAAFGGLVETYQVAIFNLCHRMLGNAPEAEDAAQETFLRAFTHLSRYDATRPFKTWLFSIASHHCIDRLRRRRIIWQDIEDELLSPQLALQAPELGPEEAVLRREQQIAMRNLLEQLVPKDRAAIVLRYWYDMSYDEIAAATGATVSAVKSRLHRARLALGCTMHPPHGRPKRRHPVAAPSPVGMGAAF